MVQRGTIRGAACTLIARKDLKFTILISSMKSQETLNIAAFRMLVKGKRYESEKLSGC